MNPTEPTPEEALRGALSPPPEAQHPSPAERQERLKASLRVETAAHHLGRFLVDGVTSVLGWIVLTIWTLVSPSDRVNQHRKDSHHDD